MLASTLGRPRRRRDGTLPLTDLAMTQAYVHQRIRGFSHAFARRFNPGISQEQVDALVRETLGALTVPDHLAQIPSNLRLVLRHDCQ